MTRSVFAALTIALALTGILVWECSDVPTADVPLPSPRLPTDMPAGRPETSEGPDVRQYRVQTQFAAILARPLFSPSRQPSQVADVPYKPEPVPEPPRLAGVLVSRDGRQAIFAPAAGGRAIVAEKGSHVGVFMVSTIAAGEVTVLSPDGGTRVLRLKPDPAARTAATPAVRVAQANPPSVLELLRSIPGEGAKPGLPGAARPGPPP